MGQSLFTTFDISGQGMSVERRRLSAVANNIANANTTKTTNGGPYQREVVSVRANKPNTFEEAFTESIGLLNSEAGHAPKQASFAKPASDIAVEAKVEKDQSPARVVYDPSHPDADDNGYVKMPNVNIVTEMVEMIAAQRGFEANSQVVAAAKNIARDSLEI